MSDIIDTICDRPMGIADLRKLVVIEIELTSDLKGLKVDVEIKGITRTQSGLTFFCVSEFSNTHMVVLKCRSL